MYSLTENNYINNGLHVNMDVSNNNNNNTKEQEPQKSCKSTSNIKPTTFLIPIGIVIIASIILSFIVFNYLPAKQRNNGVTAIISIAVTICAFYPQLMINHIEKGNATDNVAAIFLIMAAVGVMLRLPAIRQIIGISRYNKTGTLLSLLIAVVSLIPLLAHIIWQWQAVIYDTDAAFIAKEILKFSAPITTIVTIFLIFWVFTVPPIKNKK